MFVCSTVLEFRYYGCCHPCCIKIYLVNQYSWGSCSGIDEDNSPLNIHNDLYIVFVSNIRFYSMILALQKTFSSYKSGNKSSNKVLPTSEIIQNDIWGADV